MIFKNYYEYLNESYGGIDAGSLDISKINLETAREHAIKVFKEYDRDLYTELPDFDKNFQFAKSKFMKGKTKRSEMPTIADYQVKEFQRRIENGYIDINPPFHPETNPKNPFPTGLTGKKAEEFLINGLRDGEKSDDIIKVYDMSEQAKNLTPIQKQVYFDKSIRKIAIGGSKESRKFLTTETYLISSIDNFIIDGHHRYLTSLLLDPNIKLQGIKIDLQIEMLKKLALAYGDAIGNKRNK